MQNRTDIFIITGTPGSGKTTVSIELLGRYEFGLHIPIDDLREWVVSGIAYPLPEWTDETTRQFDLGYRAVAYMAGLYAEAGFTVAIDQVIYPEHVWNYFAPLILRFAVHKVFLQPKVDVALIRNAHRTNKSFDTAFLQEPIKNIHQSLRDQIQEDPGWIMIDSSLQNPAGTVDEILRRIDRV